MICVVIKGPTIEDAYQQITQALAHADLVELRLDYFSELDLVALKKLHAHFSIPMIFALRSTSQGGEYKKSEENRLADIRQLTQLKPAYLDLEYHVPLHFIEEITSQFPDNKLILSYHNFVETPQNDDLEKIYQNMRQIPACFYKMAVTAQHSLDAMRLLCWAKKMDNQLFIISMGPHGQISRILGPIMQYPITYATLEEHLTTAPGQLTAQTLLERYHYRSLNSRTALYGLIGDPVDKSISDETHNHLIATCHLDAVYVKIQITKSEVADFLQFAKQLPFRGLSVTMPLKECIFPFLDHIDSQACDIGASNTLLFEKNKISGFNTDGIGALNAIERQCVVKEKRIVILGAGGAAKAIAYEAQRRGAHVTILNRNAEKAVQIAQHLHCMGKGLNHMAACAEEGYDILINCTPVPLPIDPAYILPQAFIMDIKTKPKETEFLKHAQEKGCRIIYGYQMFVEQAIGQVNLWFKESVKTQSTREILENKAIQCVATVSGSH